MALLPRDEDECQEQQDFADQCHDRDTVRREDTRPAMSVALVSSWKSKELPRLDGAHHLHTGDSPPRVEKAHCSSAQGR